MTLERALWVIIQSPSCTNKKTKGSLFDVFFFLLFFNYKDEVMGHIMPQKSLPHDDSEAL